MSAYFHIEQHFHVQYIPVLCHCCHLSTKFKILQNFHVQNFTVLPAAYNMSDYAQFPALFSLTQPFKCLTE
jgi:hypothetical protein